MDDSYPGQPDPVGNQTLDTPEAPPSVEEWNKKFQAAERYMKYNFLWKYKLAKRRIRAENEVRSRNSYKMTHFNVALPYSIGANFVNSVYFKAPECTLTAREEVDHEKIENTEIAINDWLTDKKVKKVVRRCIWDAYSGGSGWRFIDHHYDDQPDPSNVIQPGQPAGVDPVTQQPTPEVQPVLGRVVLENKE